MTGMLIQMAAATAAVVLLIVILGRIAAKKQGGPSGIFDMLGYRSFGPKKGIAALRVGGEVLILGVTPTDIRLLTSYPEGEFAASGAGKQQAADTLQKQPSLADRVLRLRSMKDSLDG